MAIFRPLEIIERFDKLDIDKYRSMGYDTILLDIDNTIAVPDTELTASKEAKAFIKKLKDSGFRVLIYSNNVLERVKPYADSAGCEYVYFALKPLPFVYWSTMIKLKLDRHKVISLGDQLVTDGLGCNIVGIGFIYTKQLVEKDAFITSINRHTERFIFKYILHEKV